MLLCGEALLLLLLLLPALHEPPAKPMRSRVGTAESGCKAGSFAFVYGFDGDVSCAKLRANDSTSVSALSTSIGLLLPPPRDGRFATGERVDVLVAETP